MSKLLDFMKVKFMILWLILAAICLIAVTCSPRYGYQLRGEKW